jgi:hypothetical protein
MAHITKVLLESARVLVPCDAAEPVGTGTSGRIAMTCVRKIAAKISVGLLLLIAGVSMSWAQIKSCSIVGLVRDKTGGSIPGAEVSAINEETNVAVNVRSNGDGQYAVPYLAPGRYTVTATKQGFWRLAKRV